MIGYYYVRVKVKLAMDIIICGLHEVLEQIEEADCAISIVAPGYSFIRPEELYRFGKWLLELEFDDTWIEVEEPGDIFPQEEDICKVTDFIERCLHNNKRNLLIHCHEGISRSTAIAAVVYAYLGELFPYTRVLGERNNAQPNTYILDLAAEVLKVDMYL